MCVSKEEVKCSCLPKDRKNEREGKREREKNVLFFLLAFSFLLLK